MLCNRRRVGEAVAEISKREWPSGLFMRRRSEGSRSHLVITRSLCCFVPKIAPSLGIQLNSLAEVGPGRLYVRTLGSDAELGAASNVPLAFFGDERGEAVVHAARLEHPGLRGKQRAGLDPRPEARRPSMRCRQSRLRFFPRTLQAPRLS